MLGMRRAMEAMLTGDSMTGDEAVASGFANRAFPADKLDAEVLAIAERVAKVPADLQALNKRVVHRAMEAMGMRDGMRATADINALGFHQRASKEYFAKFAGESRRLSMHETVHLVIIEQERNSNEQFHRCNRYYKSQYGVARSSRVPIPVLRARA